MDPDAQCVRQIYYPLIFLAVIGAGGILLGSNPGFKELELAGLFEASNPSLVITAPELLPTVRAISKGFDIPDSKILVFANALETPKGFKSWHELFQYGEDDWVRFDNEVVAKETAACLVTTSGTTGMPKLAILSHYSWVAFNSVVDDPIPKPYQIRRYVGFTWLRALNHCESYSWQSGG